MHDLSFAGIVVTLCGPFVDGLPDCHTADNNGLHKARRAESCKLR